MCLGVFQFNYNTLSQDTEKKTHAILGVFVATSPGRTRIKGTVSDRAVIKVAIRASYRLQGLGYRYISINIRVMALFRARAVSGGTGLFEGLASEAQHAHPHPHPHSHYHPHSHPHPHPHPHPYLSGGTGLFECLASEAFT